MSIPPWIITRIERNDLADLHEIEIQTPSGWSMSQLEGELSQPSGFHFGVRSIGRQVVGYILGRSVVDEAEIIKLAVAENLRRQGIAATLLEYVLDYLPKLSINRCFLELRESNTAARRLYEKYNFSVTGHRKNYYNNPIEDAVCMTKNL